MKYLIIGGVAGGATVAARLRRLDEQAEIILVERGKYVSYANCGLPYYIGGTIDDRQKLFVQTAQGFTDRFRIDIRTEQEVIAIDRAERRVNIRRVLTGETYTESYDRLVLSPGAEPLRPRIEGIDHPRILTLRNVPDTDAIKHLVEYTEVQHAVVVGGGFIGLEMAENLRHLNIETHVVEMADQVMAPLDFSMAAIVHQHLTEQGVTLHLKNGVHHFTDENGQVGVHLNDGQVLKTDLVVLSIGVRPETKLAREAGLELGTTGGIRVNACMQTSDEAIYALGDAVEVTHLVTGKPALIPLAGPANKQGRIVADNLVLGNRRTYAGSLGTSIAKVFSLTVAATGANAKLLRRENIPYIASWTHGSSHAGYYPNAVSMSLKILFAPADGRLLGAQIVGFDGVDKRIEMLEQVIQRQGTVYDLMELEHAYAPPYSSAKDPVNMAGFVADNILSGRVQTITWRDKLLTDADSVKLDVRTAEEYALGSIPGFRNLPLDELREHLQEIPREKPVVVSCAVGLRGYLAARILMQHGFQQVFNLSGGYKTWSAATAPLQQPAAPTPEGRPQTDSAPATDTPALQVDACGLMCPGPVMQLKKNYASLAEGETLVIKATDQAFGKDVASWCKITGAELTKLDNQGGIVTTWVRKVKETDEPLPSCPSTRPAPATADHKTLIVFSDDLDRALASFVIANGAAAMGKKVTMFFTFWGLNVIKKPQKPAVQKDIFGRMFGWMLPSDSRHLSLSKLNMAGIGSRMMRMLMRRKRIDSLESLIKQAQENGVEMIACTMSMDVMGVKREELMDNVTLGGVATYLERAEEANVNLFI